METAYRERWQAEIAAGHEVSDGSPQTEVE